MSTRRGLAQVRPPFVDVVKAIWSARPELKRESCHAA